MRLRPKTGGQGTVLLMVGVWRH